MRVAFRVDASLRIGTGHVRRCLTLAEALRDVGVQSHFICREHPGNLIELIRHRGFSVGELPMSVESVGPSESYVRNNPNYATWLGADWSVDAEQTRVNIGEAGVDLLVVDHYALDTSWEQRLRPFCSHLMVIDDLANRLHDCDLLLDQNLFPDQEGRYQNVVPRTCRQLLGPRYALMRPEFLHARQALGPRVQRGGGLKRVLVSFGGSDALELTQAAVEACRGVPGITVDVVLGRPNQQMEISLSKHASVHVQVSNMAALMSQADLSVGGGGVMSWERCVVGLPALVVSLAPNQTPICRALDLIGAAEYAGESENIDMQVLRSSLYKLAASPARLAQMSATASALVDGLGSGRVADVIGSL